MNLYGVIYNTTKYKYGFTNKKVPYYLFVDLSGEKYMVAVRKELEAKNYYASVTPYNEATLIQGFPRVCISGIIGPTDDWECDLEFTRLVFAPEKHKELPPVIPPSEPFEIRENFEGWNTLNIDPEKCRDIDDCISYRFVEDEFHIAISIADVASAVLSGSPEDIDALSRSFTFYSKNDGDIEMLHPSLEHRLSLLPGKRRKVVSFVCVYSKNKLVNTFFTEAYLVNQKSYSYDSKILWEDHPQLCATLSEILRTTDSHIWIEFFMRLYNRRVAKILSKHNVGIYRVNKYNENICQKLIEINPNLAYESAKYVIYDENTGHKALKLNEYCHVTSPLRRYTDIYNQRLLKQALDLFNHQNEITDTISKESIAHINKVEKLFKRYEREVFFIENLKENEEKTLKGDFIGYNEDKTKMTVYVTEWKRLITVRKPIDMEFPDSIKTMTLKFHYNRNFANWKNRIIFEISEWS